jgi:hypothetical protein
MVKKTKWIYLDNHALLKWPHEPHLGSLAHAVSKSSWVAFPSNTHLSFSYLGIIILSVV